ncbi:MAG: flagellar hook-basal body complex protein [Polyangiaceae bacterium]
MSTGIWSAASGAVAQTTALDVASNNVANATTPGYRADRAIFRRELNQAMGNAMGTRSLKYSLVRTVEADRRQGQLVHTGKPLDVALKSSDQWFRVSTPRGERLTRVGNLTLAKDGFLKTPEGYNYLGASGAPLRVPPEAKTVSISPDGALVIDGIDSGQRSRCGRGRSECNASQRRFRADAAGTRFGSATSNRRRARDGSARVIERISARRNDESRPIRSRVRDGDQGHRRLQQHRTSHSAGSRPRKVTTRARPCSELL